MQTDPSVVALPEGLPFERPGVRARRLVAPDQHIKPYLVGGEALLARRTASRLTHIGQSSLEPAATTGSVYLTDQRLIHLSGDLRVSETTVDLRAVTELSLSGDRLLITFAPTHGIILELESPIDFRAQMALAISALRSR